MCGGTADAGGGSSRCAGVTSAARDAIHDDGQPRTARAHRRRVVDWAAVLSARAATVLDAVQRRRSVAVEHVDARYHTHTQRKSRAYLTAERRVPQLIPVLGSQPASDASHKPGGRLSLLSARPAVTLATFKRAVTNFRCLVNRGTTGVNSLCKTVTRQRHGCDLNPQ